MDSAPKDSPRNSDDEDSDGDEDDVIKGLHDVLLSWSFEDIFNKELYSDRITKFPDTFDSLEDYKKAFVYPLLEETRQDLCSSLESMSSAPYTELTECSFVSNCNIYGKLHCWWRNGVNDHFCKHETMSGDVLLLVDAMPQKVEGLRRFGRAWTLALVTKVQEKDDEDTSLIQFEALARRKTENKRSDFEFAIYLLGTTPSERMWAALHMQRSPDIIRKVLEADFMNEEQCKICSKDGGGNLDAGLSDYINDSQKRAISLCLQRVRCEHTSAVKLIWGPPGTGKTKTASVMLLSLLGTRCSTVVCAPTYVAVMELASRVLQLLRSSSSVKYGRNSKICQLGDILLFGNKMKLKIDRENEEIYLDYRVKKIRKCLAWRCCITQMVNLLNKACAMYRRFSKPAESFLEFLRDRFSSTTMQLEGCLCTLCTHISKRFIQECHVNEIIRVLSELKLFVDLLYGQDLLSLNLEEVFSSSKVESPHSTLKGPLLTLYLKRLECLSDLTYLMDYLTRQLKFPYFDSDLEIARFCYESASMLFSTACSTHRLHKGRKAPVDVLVIDEAAQLRECESMIPLHLQGLRHAILIGHERQLPSVVLSKVAKEAGFGRSMFERLSSLGAPKHLLNIQYRMHPFISLFPNYMFYSGQIHDAPNVMNRSYQKSYLPSPFFGQFSLINSTDGREERSRNGKKSLRNSVEAAIVLGILNKLFQAWWTKTPKENLSIGVISPYSAQVRVIQEKLGRRYENVDKFEVKVMTIDGFQGGEEDIIILSTVRSNCSGSIGFLSRPQLTNVALTRARYCLWIVGCEETLGRSNSEWAALVDDAKDRGCFFNADEDKDLAKVIFEAKKAGNCLEDLLYAQSLLFKYARWKVIFCDSFLDSFRNLPLQTKSSVVDLLQKLSSGWRPVMMNLNLDTVCSQSSEIMKKFEVEGFHVIWTVDIENEPKPVQVLKFWFIVPDRRLYQKRLDVWMSFTRNAVITLSIVARGNALRGIHLEVPKIWETPLDLHDNANVSRNHNKDREGRLCWDGQTLDARSLNLNGVVDDLKHITAALDGRDRKRKRKYRNEGDYRETASRFKMSCSGRAFC